MNSRLRNRRIRRSILIGLAAIIVIIASGNGVLAVSDSKLTSLAILGIAYFSGLLTILIGIFFSFMGFLGTLPIFSSIFGYIALIATKIHYVIVRVVLGKTLHRIPWYKRFELRWRNNKFVRSLVESFHSALRTLGFEKPIRIKFFEVMRCASCGEDIPMEGKFCPFCGLRTGG
ncbi:MAG: hypothetical protein ACE5G7_01200 [Candidatus Hydrothermarchaeaceae archaeon]